MNDERLRQLYQRGITAREANAARGGTACEVSPEDLLALARGDLPGERRLELLDVVMRSERCRSEFELLRAVVVAGGELDASDGVDVEDAGELEDAGERGDGADVGGDGNVEERSGTTVDPVLPPMPDVIPDVIPLDPAARARHRESRGAAPWWRRTSIPVGLAAAALVAVGLSQVMGDDAARPDVMRGASEGVVIVAPAGEIASGTRPTFVWRTVPGAARYHFELLDTEGNLLHESVTTDTSVVLPSGVTLATESEHRWIVRATDPLGAQLGSSVRALRVR